MKFGMVAYLLRWNFVETLEGLYHRAYLSQIRKFICQTLSQNSLIGPTGPVADAAGGAAGGPRGPFLGLGQFEEGSFQ